MPPPKLVIFDFDGTLFDTHASIVHSISQTFATLLPSSTSGPPSSPSPSGTDGNLASASACLPSNELIHTYIARGTGLRETFDALWASITTATPATTSTPATTTTTTTHDNSSTASTNFPGPSSRDPPASDYNYPLYESTYRKIYATQGQSLIRPFPGAVSLLHTLRQRGVLMAIVTNKGVAAVMTALENAGLKDVVDGELIVGDSTPGAERKPGVGSWEDVLKPRLSERFAGKEKGLNGWFSGEEKGKGGVKGEREDDVLVVGDTVADIQFAANIGAQSVWCRYGYGDRETCEALRPTFTVDSLDQVLALITGD